MGFDLVTRKKGRAGRSGCFSVNLTSMIELRAAMIAAGVSSDLVYQGFVSNDGHRVTAADARAIAGKMQDWLAGTDVKMDMSTSDPRERFARKTVVEVVTGLGGRPKARV